ncbi:retinol-binding protein 4-B-like [Lineus longissimus]|uniref:retinol-binding protein 4-B-like n=1 Tax=Lineus longissimus TaxID=88925 RepID=UPI002B4D0BB5
MTSRMLVSPGVVLAILAVVACTINADVAFNWNTADVQRNFNITEFTGKKWYEIKWHDATDDPWIMDNLYFYYRMDPNDDNVAKAVMVGNYRTSPDRCRKLTGGGNMKFVIPDSANPAKMRYIINSKYPESDYWILSTDYDHYALTIACDSIQTDGSCQPGTKVNVMSTSPRIRPEDERRLDGLIRTVLLMNPDTFIVTIHDRDCPM